MKFYVVPAAALLAVASALPRALAAEAPFTRPVLVSTRPDGSSPGNQSSGGAAVSGNGRYVVFQSFATDLTEERDENQDWDLFRRDLTTGEMELVSVARQGDSTGERGVSGLASLSSNGRYVAFDSRASDLVPSDTNGTSDVFLRDMTTGVTSLVSVNRQGSDSGQGSSWVAGISDDGRYVLFGSAASDLVAETSHPRLGAFVRDIKLGKTTLVSVNTAGIALGGAFAQMTPDGRFILFQAFGDDHVPGDSNGASDVFVRDLETGTTTLVSVSHEGTGSASRSSEPVAISRDGRRVAFSSSASDLVERDTNGVADLFVRDLGTGETRLVSVNLTGDDSCSGRSWVELDIRRENVFSADGRFLVFQSEAADLVANDPDTWSYDVFVRDLDAGETHLVSEGPDGHASHDNSWICCYAMSPGGRYAAFGSPSPVYAGPRVADDNATIDLFLRDLETRTTHVVTRSIYDEKTADRDSARPLFSADGRVLLFESLASDLVLEDENGSYDLFAVTFDTSAAPPPPLGDWLSSSSVPGFSFKVRISGGATSRLGSLEASCIPETLCVSGALPGRSEVFLRMVGPKPNGRLWPTLVKFSTSEVEVWVRQDGTGQVRYYLLEGARPGVDELPGLFDREGFLPVPLGAGSRVPGSSAAVAGMAARSGSAPAPPETFFTSHHFPDYRFRARISAGGQVQEVRKETGCIEETLCLSAAVPGRSEVFLRIVGPKPNGWYWPTIVKFTTSTLEVWIDRISTGEIKYYRIEGAEPDTDDLTGLFDRNGFW